MNTTDNLRTGKKWIGFTSGRNSSKFQNDQLDSARNEYPPGGEKSKTKAKIDRVAETNSSLFC